MRFRFGAAKNPCSSAPSWNRPPVSLYQYQSNRKWSTPLSAAASIFCACAPKKNVNFSTTREILLLSNFFALWRTLHASIHVDRIPFNNENWQERLQLCAPKGACHHHWVVVRLVAPQWDVRLHVPFEAGLCRLDQTPLCPVLAVQLLVVLVNVPWAIVEGADPNSATKHQAPQTHDTTHVHSNDVQSLATVEGAHAHGRYQARLGAPRTAQCLPVFSRCCTSSHCQCSGQRNRPGCE